MGKIAFVFAGQGAQHPGMGQELAEISPAAAEVFQKLDALRPLKVLGRGYDMARTEEGGHLRRSAQVRPGDRIELRLAQGSLGCRVEEVEGEETHGKENL